MTELPPAIIEHPRPAHRPTPERARAIRKAIAVAIIAGACFACWHMLKGWLRSDASKALEARQDKARAKVGPGLDKLFAAQLEAESSTVRLEAGFTFAGVLGRGYDDVNCGQGLDAAFEEALGPEVVEFSTSDGYGDEKPPRLVIIATITPSGRDFQLPHSSTPYTGIAMSGEMKFLGKSVRVDVQPAEQIEFKHVRFQSSFDKMSASEVAGGIMQGTCEQAGYALLETLTTWKRPPPPPPADPMADCDRGFRCRGNAELLEATDLATAAVLYAKACEQADDAACARAAELEVQLWSDTGKRPAESSFRLELGCSQELAGACAAAGRLALLPYEAGGQPTASRRREALALYLRACDLGANEACAAAAPLLEGTPFAGAAPLLLGAPSVRSKKLGTIFALRWGQWTRFDRGQPTAWVTKEPRPIDDGMSVTPFELDQLPAGIVAPPGVTTVYAVALERGSGERCQRCERSGGGDSLYSMRSLDCVCAIAPKSPRSRADR
ncbi:MAG: hypothetical protein M3680_13290 [Myxococcota bacterium]|nr:hypothetical protein [Myxococcota bacterium]